jgi:hypothetical protein
MNQRTWWLILVILGLLLIVGLNAGYIAGSY